MTNDPETTLAALIDEISEFRPYVLPAGYMARRIRETGSYEEDGLMITADDAPHGSIYVGLAVLSRDIALFLDVNPGNPAASEAELFRTVVDEVHRADARYGEQAFPTYQGLPIHEVSALPIGLAGAAARGMPSVQGLGSPAIVHEWTFKPGKRLLFSFVRSLGKPCKDFVCEEFGDRLNKGELQKQALAVATGVLLTGGLTAALWMPMVAFLGLGVAKRGLDRYCTLGADGEGLVIPTSW